MEQIESESRFIWRLIKDILFLPFNLILVLFKKKPFSELFKPFSDFFKFLLQAKLIFFIIMVNVLVFFVVEIIMVNTGYISIEVLESYMWRPSYLFSLNLLPMITAMFLHASFLHLFWNMLFLFALGRVVEKSLGIWKTFLVYFGAGIISMVFYALIFRFGFNVDAVGLGASGAIAGIIAGAMLLRPFYVTYILFDIPMPVVVLGLIKIYTDLFGVFSFADNFGGNIAHVGGYLSIALLMFLLGKQNREEMKKGFYISLATLVVCLLVISLIRMRFGISLF